jgi:hypothetical protein
MTDIPKDKNDIPVANLLATAHFTELKILQ